MNYDNKKKTNETDRIELVRDLKIAQATRLLSRAYTNTKNNSKSSLVDYKCI